MNRSRKSGVLMACIAVLAIASLAAMQREFLFTAGSGISLAEVDNANGTHSVQITNTSPGGTGVTSITCSSPAFCTGPTGAVVVSSVAGVLGLPLLGQGLSSAPAFTGPAIVAGGGTGLTTLGLHGIVVGENTANVNVTAAGAAGIPLIGVTSADPVFGTAVVAGGGTGDTTLTAHGVLLGEGTSAVAVTSAGTAGQVLMSAGAADPAYQPLTAAGTTACSITNPGVTPTTICSLSLTSGNVGQHLVIVAHLDVNNNTLGTAWNTVFCIGIGSTTCLGLTHDVYTQGNSGAAVFGNTSVGFFTSIAASTTDTINLVEQNSNPSTLLVTGDMQAWLTP